MTFIKSYKQAFREPFKQWDNFNRKKFWQWLWILIILACLKVYPELYQCTNQVSIDSVYMSEIFSYSIPYNKAYLRSVTNLQKYGKASIYSINYQDMNANIVTHTYGSFLDVYSQQSFFGIFEEHPDWRAKYPWLDYLQIKLPANSQYARPIRSNSIDVHDDSADPVNHLDLFKQKQLEVNKVFMSDDFAKYSHMSRTLFGNIVITTHTPTYDFVGVVDPITHSLLKCVYQYKLSKLSDMYTSSNWQPSMFRPVKFVYTSNSFYNGMVMPPVRAFIVNILNSQYTQNKMNQKKPLTPEEEEQQDPEGYVDDSGKRIPKDFYEDR